MRLLNHFKGGVTVPHNKNTAGLQTVAFDNPARVVIPMQQHIGAPCKPTVSAGEYVRMGQKIGDSDEYVSAPVHASVSGKVTAITDLLMPNGRTCKAVEIENDGADTLFEDIAPPQVSTKEDFVNAVRASGLVGLGGAGFPPHVKLNIKEGTPVDMLVINAAECEPHITADDRECIENTQDVLDGILLVCRHLGVSRAAIGIEDNKVDAANHLKKAIAGMPGAGVDIEVHSLRSRYPQGAEKVLIRAVTGRKVPMGKLPLDVGVVVMNVTSVSFSARYFKTGMPLVMRRVTVDGSAVKKPQNVMVRVGTPIEDLMEFAGGYTQAPGKILMGGPMMGIAVYDDTMPVLKQNNAILALAPADAALPEPTACIRCGRCVRACPMSLMPLYFLQAYKREDWEQAEQYNLAACIECGSCAYACPANKPFVTTLRACKAKVKAAKEAARSEQ